MSDYLDINNEELLKDFFSEAEQQVDMLESNILVIENDPENHDAIDEIFRAAHTLKGGSATVEMNELSGFTHKVEDLLDAIRSGTVKITESVVDLLLRALDVIKAMLSARAEGEVYGEDVSGIVSELEGLIPEKASPKKAGKKSVPKNIAEKLSGEASPSVKKDPERAKKPEDPSGLPVQLTEYEMLELKEAVPSGEKAYLVQVVFDEDNPMNTVGGIQVFAALKQEGQVLRTIPDFDELYSDVFHQTVYYFVSSKSSPEVLEKTAFISDVTLSSAVFDVDFSAAEGPAGMFTASGSGSTQDTPVRDDAQDSEADVPSASASDEAGAAGEDTAGTDSVSDDAKNEKNRSAHPAAAKKVAGSGSILRVDSKRVDVLMNLVSETVIVKASFNQSASQFSDLFTEFLQNESVYREKLHELFDQLPDLIAEVQEGKSLKDLKRLVNEEYSMLFDIFNDYETSMKTAINRYRSTAQNLGRIAGELQERVMKIRMVPINQIFNRFPRVVRDLSHDLGKKINLVIEGEDTELDKSVVEDLLDPIMHCVRNAVDHGIESREKRLAAGKPEEGTVLLKAGNEGNLIIIEIADDGGGIDVEAVKAKAVKRGIIHPGKNLSDTEAYQLIFSPGFSTSEKISNISGRGVGLDVVKNSIEKLNGSVSVLSRPGEGSRFVIRLPLTLAIIQGLLIRVGDEVYSIPVASVIESQRISTGEISMIDNYEVLNVRDEVISLLRLNRLFGIRITEKKDYTYVVIVGTADKKVALMVDSLIGEEDVVIKPLKDQFTNSPGIAGASILGDGSVSLIIDVNQLLDLGLRQEVEAREQRGELKW